MLAFLGIFALFVAVLCIIVSITEMATNAISAGVWMAAGALMIIASVLVFK